MSEEPKIAYEPHPVSDERKKELVSQGYRIVDAKFAPKGEKQTKESGGTSAKKQTKDSGENTKQ